MKRLALALLLLAGSAQARVRYAAPSGGTDYLNATSPGAAVNLGSVNTNATFGDSILMADGDYGSTLIAPSAAGVKFFGNKNSPTSVIVAGVTSKADMRVSGMKVTAELKITDLSNRMVVDSCDIAGGMSWDTPDDCRISNCTIRGQFNAAKESGPGVKWAMRDTLTECVFPSMSSNSWMGWTMGNSEDLNFRGVMSGLFRNITITGSATSNSWALGKMFHVAGCTFDGITIDHTITSASGQQMAYAFVIRDSSAGNTFNRCTFRIRNTNAGFGSAAFMVEAGNVQFNGMCRNNTIDSCSFITDKVFTGLAAVYFQDRVNKLTMTNTVVAARMGNALAWGGSGGTSPSDTVTLTHNTLYSGNSKAFDCDWGSGTSAGSAWTGNIYYSRGTSTCVMDFLNQFNSSASLVYRADGNASSARGDGSCTSTDSRATWGNPQFADTAWASLNLVPSLTGPAVSALFPGGYAGASNPDFSGDALPPGQINDLSGAALSATRTSLAWTAAGDDGFSGVASSTVVKRAAAQIVTETDWTNATTISTTTSTNSTGGEQQSATDNTVSASTTYWYAVRSTDDASNQGSIGNSISITTPAAGDVTAPSAIGDLAASAMGGDGRAVYLTWTAPGNDAGVGTASSYDVRYRAGNTMTDPAQWSAATAVTGEPTPAAAGSFQYLVVGGLANGTQYAFAIKATDASGNTSLISNVAVVTTNTPAAPTATTATRKKKLSRAVF